MTIREDWQRSRLIGASLKKLGLVYHRKQIGRGGEGRCSALRATTSPQPMKTTATALSLRRRLMVIAVLTKSLASMPANRSQQKQQQQTPEEDDDDEEDEDDEEEAEEEREEQLHRLMSNCQSNVIIPSSSPPSTYSTIPIPTPVLDATPSGHSSPSTAPSTIHGSCCGVVVEQSNHELFGLQPGEGCNSYDASPTISRVGLARPFLPVFVENACLCSWSL